MKFDTKIAIVLRNDLEAWQALNVTAFLMSGIAGTQDIVGQPYVDGSQQVYLPMSKQPIMIYTASANEIKQIHEKALKREIPMTIYTEEIFKTYHDEENREMVGRYETEALNLVGIGLRGKKNHVDKTVKGLSLHP